MKRHMGQLTALLCGLALWFGAVMYQKPLQLSGVREWMRVLSNGALVPGVLFVGISGLVWIAGEGLFDGIRYSMSRMKSQFFGRNKNYSFYDYTRREKKHGSSYPMLIPGLLFLALSVVLTVLFYL